MSSSSFSRTRRPKWQPTLPPPPTPKILHLPRRNRRKQPPQPKTTTPTSTKTNSTKFSYDPLSMHKKYYYFLGSKKGRLESLFGQEREFSRTDSDVPVVLLNSSSSLSSSDHERRERVEDRSSDGVLVESDWIENDGFGEEKWKFQAEILRAECNFLRMERQFALKKLERNRKQLERALTSAVQTLISGRKKTCEEKNGNGEFEEELEELTEKLRELQKSSRGKNAELRDCHNFDKHASRLQHRIEKLGGQVEFEKKIQENEELSLLTHLSDNNDKGSGVSELKITSKSSDNANVEVLRRKMEGFSKGMLDRMEDECGSMLTTPADSSVASSASTSKRMDYYSQQSCSLTRQMCQEQLLFEENKCSGRCKTLVRRIMDQVRAETEQWSQMQEMLGQVRAEMEEMQASRDLWEDRALKSELEIPVLQSVVRELKENALNSEAKADALQTELLKLKEQLNQRLRSECGNEEEKNSSLVSVSKQIKAENNSTKLKITTKTEEKMADGTMVTVKNLVPLSLGKQLEQEKRLLQLRRKENRQKNTEKYIEAELNGHGRRKSNACNDGILESKRTPFRNIGNSSPLTMPNPKVLSCMIDPKTK